MDFIAEAKIIVSELKERDPEFKIFGASKHKYQFGECLSEREVSSVEERLQINFPQGYRKFITELGNGGPGPNYGIWPLPTNLDHLCVEFVHAPGDIPPEVESDDFPWPPEINGALSIEDYGCGTCILLVVNGASAGKIWWLNEYPVLPFEELSFEQWWLREMRAKLSD